MARPFSAYSRELLLDPKKTPKPVEYPVLLWEVGSRVTEDSEMTITASGESDARPQPGDPLVLLVRPDGTLSTAGITVGRSQSNDVVLENASVSRFHALIHRNERTKEWTIADAGSRNGTWVDGTKVDREHMTVLKDGSHLKLGEVELRFLLPETFAQEVAKASKR